MMKQMLLLSLLLASFLPMTSAAIPAIDELEGFEVDMEPMWVDYDGETADADEPLDIEGYFTTEMKAVLPNIIGVILKKTQGNDGTQVFYTGMAVFQGPPFRTNHDVYMAQTSALTSLKAASSFFHVYNASLGIPTWFDASALGDKNVLFDEESDGTTVNFTTNDSGVSLGSMGVGLALGFVVGVMVTSMCILGTRIMQRKHELCETDSPGHKRKVSNISLENVDMEDDDEDDDESVSIKNSNSFREEFHDEENPKEPCSPVRRIHAFKSNTPLKRRPSHHRRVKSSAFHDTESPSSVMDGIHGQGSGASNHRRSNSMAGPRRASMVDLLDVNMAELMDDDDFNDL